MCFFFQVGAQKADEKMWGCLPFVFLNPSVRIPDVYTSSRTLIPRALGSEHGVRAKYFLLCDDFYCWGALLI
jgi:hypothetical protein